VWVADRLFRQGHLSEDALAAAIAVGERPSHLDRCAQCSARALDLGRWLEALRVEATAEADAAFPAERLAAQHNQILRRIAQVEQPVRVLEFPKAPPLARSAGPLRRVSPGWLGVAAAAGLAVGVIGGHFSARLSAPPAGAATESTSVPLGVEPPVPAGPGVTPLFELDLERAMPASLREMDENTPSLVAVQLAAAR
jgi:hypothetical protein